MPKEALCNPDRIPLLVNLYIAESKQRTYLEVPDSDFLASMSKEILELATGEPCLQENCQSWMPTAARGSPDKCCSCRLGFSEEECPNEPWGHGGVEA